MRVKFPIAHGMLRRLWEVIDTDWLEKEGEILFDLKRWGQSALRLDYWKRQASDGCIGFCGIGSMVLDTHRTKLLVHAIDWILESYRCEPGAVAQRCCSRVLSRIGQGCRCKAHWALLPACLGFAENLTGCR